MARWIFPAWLLLGAIWPLSGASPANSSEFTGKYYTGCHNGAARLGGLDLAALAFEPANQGNFAEWVKVHDRLRAGEMPPKAVKNRPNSAELEAFLRGLEASLNTAEVKMTKR